MNPPPSGRARHRVLVALCAVPALVLLPFRPAQAAPPTNDDIDGATVISTSPFVDQVDTTEATAEPDDANLNCWETLNSVWYSFTPTADVNVRVGTFGSDYDTTLCVYMGTPGPTTQITRNDDTGGAQSQVDFEAIEGSTYFILAGAYSGGGGNLALRVAALHIDVDVDHPVSLDPQTGLATLSGTVSCDPPMYIEVNGALEQKSAIGSFSTAVTWCEGELDWADTVQPQDDAFKSGAAIVHWEVCGGNDPDWTCIEFEELVTLKKMKKPK